MQLYAILRRSGWRSAEELGEAAERSTNVGKRSDGRRGPLWIRSYVLEEGGGTVGTVCIYEAISPKALAEHRPSLADLPIDEVIPVADTVIVRPDPGPGYGLTPAAEYAVSTYSRTMRVAQKRGASVFSEARMRSIQASGRPSGPRS